MKYIKNCFIKLKLQFSELLSDLYGKILNLY